MQEVGLYFYPEDYTRENVEKRFLIDHPGYKYNDTYPRKYPISTDVIRFYYPLESGKKSETISVIPPYLLSRKRRCVNIFLGLIQNHYMKFEKIETIWKYYDTHFNNLSTFRNYFNCLMKQCDDLIKTLSKLIIELDSSTKIPDIYPDQNSNIDKLNILFNILDKLCVIYHKKYLFGPILESEKYYFLNYIYSFCSGKKLLSLDSG